MRGERLAEAAAQEPPRSLAKGASIFLDFDGTLVELAEHPDAVSVSPRVARLMQELAECFSRRVAVLSGRSVAQISSLLKVEPLSIGGSHGIEMRWSDGRMRDADRPAALDEAFAAMTALRERFPGIVVEDKPHGVALHYRQAPEAEAECRTLAQRLSKRTGLPLQSGKMVFELKSTTTDKGEALETFMREPPMAGTLPLFFGDDQTDEPGFAAAERLGGAGVLVGRARETAARYRLDDVEAVLAWLEGACEVAA
jgi:trehalose 6-phosphate phosphatase